MAHTFSQSYIHVVFAVEGRQTLIAPGNNEFSQGIYGITSASIMGMIEADMKTLVPLLTELECLWI
jgi:hypothetical protein